MCMRFTLACTQTYMQTHKKDKHTPHCFHVLSYDPAYCHTNRILNSKIHTETSSSKVNRNLKKFQIRHAKSK